MFNSTFQRLFISNFNKLLSKKNSKVGESYENGNLYRTETESYVWGFLFNCPLDGHFSYEVNTFGIVQLVYIYILLLISQFNQCYFLYIFYIIFIFLILICN